MARLSRLPIFPSPFVPNITFSRNCRAEYFAQLMLTLNYNVFTDILFHRFSIFFDVILEEDHAMMLLPHMLKSGRDNPRPPIILKHSAILHAILKHVTYDELDKLSDTMDRRTSITIRLCELALKRLTDVAFTEVPSTSVEFSVCRLYYH